MKLPGSPAFWVSFTMVVGGMSTALISPLYPLYQSLWSLPVSQVSLIYVVYMCGALGSLLMLGRLSDQLGFARVMLAGLVLMLGGTLLTVLAWNLSSLIIGRFIVGVAASLITTSGSMGLTLMSPKDGLQRVAMLSSVLIAFGFGMGPLLGGIMGQWAPAPLHTAYLPVLLLGSLAVWGLWQQNFAPPPRQAEAAKLWRWLAYLLPRLTWPARTDSGAFTLTCGLPFLAFGVFGLYAAMAPLFLNKMVSWHGPVVGGAAIALILLASAGVQILSRRLHIHLNGFWGLLALAISNALMILNLNLGSAVVFALGVLLAATGHGMSMLAGSSMVTRLARPDNRAGMLATYWVIGYVGAIVPMLAMGWIADHWGLDLAVELFCALIIVLASVLALAVLIHPRLRTAQD
ncbi:MFS transporter [Pseudomonas sp. 5P_3.1_Bac2]|uniref:MFS transporter n=1 Tax=Pseudomonas sp. 5P_3.1_Bac2 TaxID=2971617 RepID=UPI0021CA8943|nr:MFS transporter [Pseudomonas sp. 5P_3.1_Bac2]MCU1717830.1 MFS transporter [Pseudomonas sp. 5P_3.1_Bac2]